ncbi:hypothetical protein ARMSODRAFT_1016314 [Armillaria solidipes]|uniref:Uncharacterized protein n=1 Tax=Armillaria solidipes TaxID=1076256 RepID=A0A2H3BN88_9AGAR|nr:hypothetical protein ARMSODRAFT_1016314 [Armillaria solidipes]
MSKAMTTTQIDEKNSPARLVIRRYILFILTMALEENMSMYQDFLLYHADIMTKVRWRFRLIVLRAIVFHHRLYLTCVRFEVRNDEQSKLKADILVHVRAIDIHTRTVVQYKDDFGLSALCTRLESFLANPDFDHHLISISGLLGSCAHNGIPIPSRIYAAFVDKVATEILSQDADPDDVKRKNLQASTAIN